MVFKTYWWLIGNKGICHIGIMYGLCFISSFSTNPQKEDGAGEVFHANQGVLYRLSNQLLSDLMDKCLGTRFGV